MGCKCIKVSYKSFLVRFSQRRSWKSRYKGDGPMNLKKSFFYVEKKLEINRWMTWVKKESKTKEINKERERGDV